jgi:2-isopropylmalate synthase
MAADYAIALASSWRFGYRFCYEQLYPCRPEPPDRPCVRYRARPERPAAAAPRAQITPTPSFVAPCLPDKLWQIQCFDPREEHNMTDHLIIFDTTLRDGEQSPGASMTKEEKMRIARQLERLRVDVIEAGFPASSNGDWEAVHDIAKAIKDSTVCGLARANEKDIERCGDAVKPAKSQRIHTFIATSPIHMQMKLRMSPEQVFEQAVKAVQWARRYTDNVEFSPEDAGRSEPDFLCRLLEAVISAGATTVNIPDTVGYTMPWQFGALIKSLRERIPNSDRAVWSVHCHNDLGLAVANSLSAVMNGARQVECTVNGLGERAGNASLEEIVMAVRTRKDVFPCTTRIDATQIVAASKMVSSITGFPVQPNKAIVGANAFAHESGIHQDGVIKHRETYEIMRAEDVGWNANKLVLGKLSGRNAFKTRLGELGIDLGSEDAVNIAFAKFKELADKKGEVFDEDLHAIVSDEDVTPEREHYKLAALKVTSETGTVPHARVVMGVGDSEVVAEVSGDGPVDAVFKAIERMVSSRATLLLYSVNAITTGSNAQGEVTVRLERDGRIVNGNGADTDIIVASAKAYLNALNKLQSGVIRLNPQLAA